MSEVRVNKLSPRSGTTVTLGDSGDTISIPSGVTLSNAGTNTFASATITGDLTVDTNTLYVDSTNNRVGIGTTSPGRKVVIYDNSDPYLAFQNSTTGTGTSDGLLIGIGSVNSFIINRENQPILFSTNNTERMRIDSSGNLLVDKTSSNYQTVGHELKDGGRAFHTADGGKALSLNRLTNDGGIVDFYKDGTEIGQIAVSGNRMNIGTGNTAIRFDSNSRIILPWNVTSNSGTGVDNAIDLGASGGYGFKDLYLGGGLYVGGTGTANKLDDYEEGTWTPAVSTDGGTLSLNYAERAGKYTKIGNIVTYEFYIETTSFSGGTGAILFSGLPFTVSSGRGSIGLSAGSRIALGLESAVIVPIAGASTFRIRIKNSTGTGSSDNLVNLDATDWSNLNPTVLYGSGYYRV